MDHILHALLRVDSPIVEKVTGELSMQKLRAIYFLGKNSNGIQRELADYLGVSVSNTSVMVDALVKKTLSSAQTVSSLIVKLATGSG